MSLFHKHEWLEIIRTYAPPVEIKVESLRGAGMIEMLERAHFGVTSILWKCDECQSFRQDELLGHQIREGLPRND